MGEELIAALHERGQQMTIIDVKPLEIFERYISFDSKEESHIFSRSLRIEP